jgi:hypothetical protein
MRAHLIFVYFTKWIMRLYFVRVYVLHPKCPQKIARAQNRKRKAQEHFRLNHDLLPAFLCSCIFKRTHRFMWNVQLQWVVEGWGVGGWWSELLRGDGQTVTKLIGALCNCLLRRRLKEVLTVTCHVALGLVPGKCPRGEMFIPLLWLTLSSSNSCCAVQPN